MMFSSSQVEEFNDKQKEVEAVCNPIITKMYQSAGGDPGKINDDFRSRLYLSRGGSRKVNLDTCPLAIHKRGFFSDIRSPSTQLKGGGVGGVNLLIFLPLFIIT
jgi:hypothetical protein